MTDEAMSPLRRRMIEDMTIRKLAPKTQQGYIRTIKDFSAFLGRSPDTAKIRGRPTLSIASGGERRAHPGSQSHRGSVAVLLQGHAQALRTSSSTLRSSTSRASCRSCSVRRRWRGC